MKFTPMPSLCLNLMECRFALLTRHRLKLGVCRDTIELERIIHTYIKENNKQL